MQAKLNKIIQADCLDYLKSLPDGCVSCFLIDEPYLLLKGHKIEEGYNLDIAKQIRIEAMRVLKKDGWFIFFSQFPMAWDFGRITMEAGFKPWQQCNEIVWCKRSHSNPFGEIGRIHENIFVFQKGNPQIYENKAPSGDIIYSNYLHGLQDEQTLAGMIKEYEKIVKHAREGTYSRDIENVRTRKPTAKNDEFYSHVFNMCINTFNKTGKHFESCRWSHERRVQSVWTFLPENKTKFNSNKTGSQSGININHPTVKPVLLLRRLIKLFTQQCDTICDVFAGSGTTALASVQEGRNFLCCERDEGYVKIANDRLANCKQDLERQDKWLNDRGVMDFESDIKEEVKQQSNQNSLF